MDVKTAVSRIFRVFAGVNPQTLGSDWQNGISEEIDCIRRDENTALREIFRIFQLCSNGFGPQASGVLQWENGALALLRILAIGGSPTAQVFLRETARASGTTAQWGTVRAEAQRLCAPVYPVASNAAPAPIPYRPTPVQAPPPAVRPAAAAARTSFKGLALAVILLFAAWLIALTDGTRTDVCSNAILCISTASYCLLLGCAQTLLYRRRYVCGIIILLLGALLSALSLGWAKLLHIGSDRGFFTMFGSAQLWLDFLVALIPAALTALCGILLPRLTRASGQTVSLLGGLAVSISAAAIMLLSLPLVSPLSVLFSLFAGLMLGAFSAAAALFTERAVPQPPRRIALGGGTIAWFCVSIVITLVADFFLLDMEEYYFPLFAFLLTLVQLVMLIRLLCKRHKGYIWYAASAGAVALAGLMYFFLAFVVSETWLPIVLVSALLCAVGPAVGYFFVRRVWNTAPAARRPAATVYAPPVYPQPPQYVRPPQYVPPQYPQPPQAGRPPYDQR